MTETALISSERIERSILLIRGHKVMLDRDLAVLYEVTTGNLNKAVKRNLDRNEEAVERWRIPSRNKAWRCSRAFYGASGLRW